MRIKGQATAGQPPDPRDLSALLPFSPSTPREKWMREKTSDKIKHLGANHQANYWANDVIVNETMPQIIVAR